jgi:diguanylate cyclase (GGDEF)-like protein
VTENTIQQLILKRFFVAAATYCLVLGVGWIAFLGDYFRGALPTAVIGTGLAVLCQLTLWRVFARGINLRFADPSLTEFQVILAVIWHTWFLAQLEVARGSLLVVYVLILLFGLFHLGRGIFIRCAVLVFCAFAGLNLWESYTGRLADTDLAVLQVCVLMVVLVWLCFYASYVQASRHRMRQRRFALQAHQDTLRGMMRQLEDLVATDELTGLFNRRHFLRLASRELMHLNNGARDGLALIDLDHFKRINDMHGHAAGDQVLQAFAAVAVGCLREGDILARYGGEEFVLLLPNCDQAQLAACCERLRQAFAASTPLGEHSPGLSLSAGMTMLAAGDELDEALQRADQALYRAKRGGRNQCAAAGEVE